MSLQWYGSFFRQSRKGVQLQLLIYTFNSVCMSMKPKIFCTSSSSSPSLLSSCCRDIRGLHKKKKGRALVWHEILSANNDNSNETRPEVGQEVATKSPYHLTPYGVAATTLEIPFGVSFSFFFFFFFDECLNLM